MKITKLGHCCLLIEVQGKRILTDPGIFTAQNTLPADIDMVIISHEHSDHMHIDSVKDILLKSPHAQIICNSAVGKILDEASIPYTTLEGNASQEFDGIFLQANDAKHAEIYKERGQVQNTGYFITHDLFYPGDSFENPVHDASILALPVAGPWCRFPDAIAFALAVKPKYAFPVHDAVLREEFASGMQNMLKDILHEHDIEFRPMHAGDIEDFS